jgi:tripartite-type tricarboxylate transporter receptor subunit TctC
MLNTIARRYAFMALGLLLAAVRVEAQPWPSKPIKAVVPFAAGSAVDIASRAVLEQLSTQLGQSIVVDNRGGAGGTIGTALVAKADPDGYTLLATSSAHAIAPSLNANLGYDPLRDFAAVAPIGLNPFVLVVAPEKGYKTARDFVAAANAKPGTFNFASVGEGSASHLSAERLRLSAGMQAVHIPFKGGPEAMIEVMAGRVDFFLMAMGAALPQIRQGKLTALAVNSAKRSAVLPTVPTTEEAGYSNAEYPTWFGLFLPARTPREIVDRLQRETAKALQDPKLRERLATLGVEPMIMTASEFQTQVEKELIINAELVKAVGLKSK